MERERDKIGSHNGAECSKNAVDLGRNDTREGRSESLDEERILRETDTQHTDEIS